MLVAFSYKTNKQTNKTRIEEGRGRKETRKEGRKEKEKNFLQFWRLGSPRSKNMPLVRVFLLHHPMAEGQERVKEQEGKRG